MSIPARISLSGAAPAFHPEPGRVYRISLAWWDPSEPEGQREPVLVASRRGVARTLVIVWPTGPDGMLDLQRLRGGEVEVLPWDLDERSAEQLREIARQFPLDRHDLLTRPRGLSPLARTLRSANLGIGLDRRIEASILREIS